MRNASVLGVSAPAFALMLSGCGQGGSSQDAKDDAVQAPCSTAETLRALTGDVLIDEVEHGSIAGDGSSRGRCRLRAGHGHHRPRAG